MVAEKTPARKINEKKKKETPLAWGDKKKKKKEPGSLRNVRLLHPNT